MLGASARLLGGADGPPCVPCVCRSADIRLAMPPAMLEPLVAAAGAPPALAAPVAPGMPGSVCPGCRPMVGPHIT